MRTDHIVPVATFDADVGAAPPVLRVFKPRGTTPIHVMRQCTDPTPEEGVDVVPQTCNTSEQGVDVVSQTNTSEQAADVVPQTCNTSEQSVDVVCPTHL